MESLHSRLSVDSINPLDESELASTCSPKRERPESKHDHHRSYGGTSFAERERKLPIDHGGQMFNDLDKGKIGKELRDIETEEPADPNIVWWDGDDDPANPLNWSAWSKWMNFSIVAVATFIVPLASCMIAPALTQVVAEFNIDNDFLASFVVSIYVLGLAFGPLLLGPFSEVYGRWICYTICNILYLVFNIASAVSSSFPMLVVFRFLAGAMGSAPLTIGGGTIADLFPVHQRGVALSFYLLGPTSGPAIGPAAGGFLAQDKGWRWIFWSLAIVSGAITIVQIAFSRETYAIVILDRKTKRLRKETGNPDLRSRLDRGISGTEILKLAIVRPTKMALFSPINTILAVLSAIIYGAMYLLLTTFPMVFESVYGFSTAISGLAYVGLGVGSVLGLLIFSFTSDRYIAQRAAKGVLKPEDRLPLLILSGPIIAIGYVWYGWSSRPQVHWMVPIVGSGILGMGNMFFFLPMVGYLVDAFTIYAASAIAASTVLRSIGGALLPLAGPIMYEKLGFGWGNTLLAGLVFMFTPVLIMVYRHGEYIRIRWPLNL